MMNKGLSIFLIVSMVLSGLIVGQLFVSMPVTAPGTDLPDLTISEENISILPSDPTVGDHVYINTTIWNIGNADARNVKVNFYEEETLIGTKNVDVLIEGVWNKYTIDSGGNVGGYSSIALDSMDGIHISYFDYTYSDLKYAFEPVGGSWTTYTVDSTGDVGKYTSIAIDDLNGVHISYFDETNYDLKYAFKPSGGVWNTYTIDSTGDVGASSSIAVDGSGGVHICYYDGTNADLKYAYKPNGGSWSNHTVDSSWQVGVCPSIAVDSANGVHISYHNTTYCSLKYAYKPNGGSWIYYPIATIGENVDLATSIAVDSANGVHISYHENIDDTLRYAYKPSGGSWTEQTVDSLPSVGSYNSLAIDETDGVHISYRDWDNRDLKYAYKPSGGSWAIHTIDYIGDVGLYTAIAVKGKDDIHISYRDSTNSDLKHAALFPYPGFFQTEILWTPTTAGLRNITVRIDEDNEIEELNETNNNATVSITVAPGPLASIEVIPSSVILELNETQQFIASGYDSYGNEVSTSQTWSVSGIGGTIDQNGLFTATYPGIWTVYANQSGVSAIATVTGQVNRPF
ncbi:MAG: hypothetical protein JSW28_06625 [Thermoplasmata archaeon]|nr:MAG: hypothetical protein JSW28_06625 [Thermoplasmata archaeon]